MLKVGDRVKSTDPTRKVTGAVSGRDGEYIYVTEDISEREYEFYDCELIKLVDTDSAS